MNAIVKPHWFPAREWPIERVTKLWIVVRYNDRATEKFSRKTGYEAGAFQDRSSNTPAEIVNLAEINAMADANGGTWRSKS